MRAANPDLWEAFLGGEKPMEMAYLTAIARASDFPAPDPWFAGGFMNYYYFGWYLLTVPMRAMRVLPEVGFNLGVATYAALTAVTAFSIVHNLVAISRARWSGVTPRNLRPQLEPVLWACVTPRHRQPRCAPPPQRPDLARQRMGRRRPASRSWATSSPSLAATGRGPEERRSSGSTGGQPSRVNRGNFDITEFPYFTFLFGDLHPHMMGLVFVGLTVSLAIAYLLASRDAITAEPVVGRGPGPHAPAWPES